MYFPILIRKFKIRSLYPYFKHYDLLLSSHGTCHPITYYDLKDKTVEPRNTRSVFSEEVYYPEGIEKDLCQKAEYLFANLFHNKLENAGNSITLTVDELFVLKKYLIVSAIRYKYEFTDEEKKLSEILGPEHLIILQI